MKEIAPFLTECLQKGSDQRERTVPAASTWAPHNRDEILATSAAPKIEGVTGGRTLATFSHNAACPDDEPSGKLGSTPAASISTRLHLAYGKPKARSRQANDAGEMP
jgi:hypothetical protein